MAAVEANLDAQLPGIDAYLAATTANPTAPAPTHPLLPAIPESLIEQIISRSRAEMRNIYRDEIAQDVANEIANEGRRLLRNQAEYFEQVQWRIDKLQEDAKREQERLDTKMENLVKGLETLILSRLPNAPEPQLTNPPSTVEITDSSFVPNPSAPPYQPKNECPAGSQGASAGAPSRAAPGWHVGSRSTHPPGSPVSSTPNRTHTTHASDTSQRRQSLFRRPKIDIEPYDGDPQKWPRFISAFNDMVEADSSLSPGDEMRLLKSCLSDRIKDSLGLLLEDPNLYDDAVEELSSTYGNPLLVSRAIISKIRALPRVPSVSDFSTLHRFSTTLRGAVATLQSGGFESEVNSGSLLEIVLEKLPSELKSQWGQRVISVYPTLLTLRDFDQWLHCIVKGEMVVRHSLYSELTDRPKAKRDTNLIDATRTRRAVLATFNESSETSESSIKPCPACEQSHRLDDCATFKSMTLEKRAGIIRDNRSCLRCLKSGHMSRQCWRKRSCGVNKCQLRHHPLLHGAPPIYVPTTAHQADDDGDSDSDNSASAKNIGTSFSDHSDCDVALTVVPVTVLNAGIRVDTLAVLDSGAEISLIAQPVANTLKLRGPKLPLTISTLTGNGEHMSSIATSVVVASRDHSFVIAVPQVRVVPELNLQRRVFDWPRLKAWPHLAPLDLPKIDYTRITVMLGRDVRVHSPSREICAPANSPGPDAIQTPFGWAVVGPLHLTTSLHGRRPMVNMVALLTATAAAEIRENLSRIHDDLSLGTIKPSSEKRVSPSELRAATILKATTRHLGDRYEVGLLWQRDDVVLPNNYTLAVRLFSYQERRFERSPAFAARYHAEMQSYISEGYAVELTPGMNATAKEGRIWYLPHHGVTSPAKPDKLRLVFNCSSRFQEQDCWRLRLAWDQQLPESIIVPWTEWLQASKVLSTLRIPRCMRRPGEPLSYELHKFTDASTEGYAACVYLRTVYRGDIIFVRLVCAKSRVAPVRQQTVPRLELQGATIGSLLAATIAEQLDLPSLARRLWTDSVTVLSWLNSTTCRYHAFVANRVTTILENSAIDDWHHVPGSLNSADEASRGLKPDELHSAHRWFRGPSFLWLPRDAWPTRPDIPVSSPDDPEVCLKRWIGTMTVKNEHLYTQMTRFSSMFRLQRAFARAQRYVRVLYLRVSSHRAVSEDCAGARMPTEMPSFLLPTELESARNLLIKLDQSHHFSCEIMALHRGKPIPTESKLLALSPFLDDSIILRVGGRLDRCELSYGFKHPIILHHDSRLARLLIKEVHERYAHSRVSRTIAELRDQFYILRFRSVVRSVVFHCAQCRRDSVQPVPPLMAALPAQRVTAHLPPFSFVGIDYFGPYDVVILRRKVKRGVVLFTCLTTRAVHLEVAHAMDTHSFLMAFSRFTDRRGLPTEVWSDNGTNLTRGEIELRSILNTFDQDIIGAKLASRRVKWTFSPPAAPHFGVIWERLVKSAKTALRAILHNRALTEEVLRPAHRSLALKLF